MQIGDEEVLTLKQAAERSGKSMSTLRTQIKRGVLAGRREGRDWLVTASALKRYMERHAGKGGFANPDHPMHGKQGPGHRRKKNESDTP